MSAPHLTRDDLQGQIDRLKRHGRKLLAIFGTGERAEVVPEGNSSTERIEIVPVRSELELRACLPALADERRYAFLVPFEGQLPADISGRFIGYGAIAHIGPAAKLAARTGAAMATDEAAKMKLASYLLGEKQGRAYPARVQELTAKDLVNAWLSKDWDVPVEGGLALDALLGWGAVDARGGLFAQEMQAAAAAGVLEELEVHLEAQLGVVGRLIFRQWRAGKGAELLALSILAEVLAPHIEGRLKEWAKFTLKTMGVHEPGVNEPSVDARQLFYELSALCRPALSWVKSREPSRIPRLLHLAEGIIERDYDDLVIESARLPRAWGLRLKALSGALAQLAQEPTRSHLDAALQAWAKLEKHELFLLESKALVVKRAERALQLGAWLVARPELKREAPVSSHADVEVLGCWYAEEGGFIDSARRFVRPEHTPELCGGIEAILEAVDAAREQLDARFAKALSAWTSSGRPYSNVLPIDAALKKVAVSFLDQDTDRKLLVLLMDGMAWAAAVELLDSMAQNGRRWGPIAWHHIGKNRIGPGDHPAMLAALPTITEVSRAAFFAGALPKNGSTLSTAKDTDRFADNKMLHPFCELDVKPRLLLRSEGHTMDGSLSDEARHLITSTKERRIVGIVVNAIDSSLKGDSQQHTEWRVELIRSLEEILDLAQESGRHILFTADHGHVAADRLQPLPGIKGDGARWRTWNGSADALAAGEGKFSGDGVYLQKGSEAVVLLESDGVRYGGAPHAGEHGGAALAEVVTPCVLLGWDDEVRTKQDPALAVRSLRKPDWWNLSLPEEHEVVRDEPAPKPKRKKTVSEKQTSLFDAQPAEGPQAPATSPPPSTGKTADLLPQLYNSEMLKARATTAELRKTVVRAISFLLSRGGSAPAEAFASHLGIPAFRVLSTISVLQEVVNLDGYKIIGIERIHQQITLDKVKLEQQFEIKL